jgi:hypothetical protein
MVFRHIDPQIKEQILWLHHHAALDDITLSDLFNVSERSIQHWAHAAHTGFVLQQH